MSISLLLRLLFLFFSVFLASLSLVTDAAPLTNSKALGSFYLKQPPAFLLRNNVKISSLHQAKEWPLSGYAVTKPTAFFLPSFLYHSPAQSHSSSSPPPPPLVKPTFLRTLPKGHRAPSPLRSTPARRWVSRQHQHHLYSIDAADPYRCRGTLSSLPSERSNQGALCSLSAGHSLHAVSNEEEEQQQKPNPQRHLVGGRESSSLSSYITPAGVKDESTNSVLTGFGSLGGDTSSFPALVPLNDAMHTPLTRHPHSLQDAGQIADLPKPADQRSEVKTGGQPSFLSLRENEECSSTLSLLGEKKRRIVLLGSTGSIGRSTLEVVEEYPERFGVVGLAANGSRLPRLVEQILFFSPRYVVVGEEEKAQRLRELLDHPDTVKKLRVYPEILFGDDGLVELATRIEDYDILVSAIVGFKGVRPTIEALRRGKHVALANKEALVAAGEVFRTVYTQQGFRKTSTAQPAETNALGLYAQDHPNSITEERHTKESPGSKKTNPIKVTKNSYMIKEKPPTPGLLLPIDSEHSAIFQALQGVPSSCYPPRRILLTASGGPFRKKSREDLKNVTLRDALKHPKWSMGAKITIDSATMMNKGLEVIEAHFAFGCPYTSIEVLIHPQAIMHSGIELHDGAVLAQMGVPDMKLPIAYALTWPRRLKTSWPRLDLTREEPLTFEKPDLEKFGCLKLAYEAGRKGGLAPACLNAANEVAVERFRKEEISFLHIEETVRRVLQLYDTTDKSLSSSHGVTLEDVFEADRWARTVAGELKL